MINQLNSPINKNQPRKTFDCDNLAEPKNQNLNPTTANSAEPPTSSQIKSNNPMKVPNPKTMNQSQFNIPETKTKIDQLQCSITQEESQIEPPTFMPKSTTTAVKQLSDFWNDSPPDFQISESLNEGGGVRGWALDFDQLLSDPIGIKAFTVS